MYEKFFGLDKRPFSLTADPAFLLLTQQHREALAGLGYAILSHKGLVVLTGEAGTGKTTLLARALDHLPAARLHSSVILNPTLTPREFLELALLDFGLGQVPESKAQRIWRLQDLLLQCHREKKTAVLIVDEAQKLSPEVLEEVRLLGNFEYSGDKLLQIVLIGQPELSVLLNQENLRQFKQRIAVRLSIHPLSTREIHDYIHHRWTKAGGRAAAPFESAAITAIAKASRGVPRLVNSICDNALLNAFAQSKSIVDVGDVNSAMADLDLLAGSASASNKRSVEGSAVQQLEVPGRVSPPGSAGRPRQSLLDRWTERFGLTPHNGRLE